MKKIITFLLMLGCISLNAQNSADKFTTGSSDQARDPRVDQMNYVPNEVLVKFKDEVPLNSSARLRSAGLSAVDKVLQANGIDSLVRLFPNTKSSLLRSTGAARIVKDPQGRDMKIPNLDKIYKITIPQLRSTSSVPVNIFQVIEDLKALPEVEYAEPNYIYSVDDMKPVGPVLTADDVKKMQSGLRSSQTAVVPNDPLYSQQWYIPAVKADLVWAQTTGDTTQVIGILDTGVDWNHPDLKNKIWTNPGEIPGNGIDDDGNGLIDDIRGWDFINNDNNPMDDNSHGTHVAGIAAAETNNGIGIAGVNWNAKILPIKVFNRSGYGDVITISRGIIYASNNGSTVINMSFGTYAYSSTLENALINAYANGSLLVASAGNDNHNIYDVDIFNRSFAAFPAAHPFVFGVQSDGGYSNYDPDGPVFSKYGRGYNYELKAPGSVILSTIPNGNYRFLTGTSMAAPIISGAVALYRSLYPEREIEMLWSDFIHSSSDLSDLNVAFFNVSKESVLDLQSFAITDSSLGSDCDGFADAGEIIDLVLLIRNTGYPANNVYAKIKHIDGETSDITVLNDSVTIGSIGIYRTLDNSSNPFKIKINDNCFNNRIISLEVTLYNMLDNPITQIIDFKIYNGTELSGILLRDTTLTPDKNWIITNSLRISQGVTLKVLPGTNLEIHTPLDNRGKFVAIGTPENRIKINGVNGNHYNVINGNTTFSYTDIDLNGYSLNCSSIDHTTISNGWVVDIKKIIKSNITNLIARVEYDSIFSSLYDKSPIGFNSGKDVYIYNCLFDDLAMADAFYLPGSTVKNSVFANFKNYNYYYNPAMYNTFKNTGYLISINETSKNISNNSFLYNDVGTKFIKTEGSVDLVSLPNQYWGTTNTVKIKNKYRDFTNSSELPYFDFEPKLEIPSDSCPGHVWKVLVNGKDAQDESVDPVGSGKHRFDVYFNRPMNKNITPQVSFGGLYPYTSNKINDDGFWSEDGKIYTVFKSIKLTTGDGINRIRVANARQTGDWEWDIPVEDQRFSFIISAANSSSIEFMATPGLGKVKLEWNNNDLVDGLGYNMYRMEHINDSTLTSPVIVNALLITDTLFTDYSVIPNKKYFYFYKIVRTDLSETDSSKVVSTIPFTASKGDANGDLSVNVLDITTIVAYLLNNNPQPFITEAADMNSDGNINVLDIVGVVNQVLYGGLRSTSTAEDQQVSLYLQNDTLFADATTAIGGLQFDISGVTSINDIQILNALQMFESGYSQRDSTTLRLLYYSMSGKSVAAGNRIPLLKLKIDCSLKDVIVSDKAGAAIPVSLSDPTIGNRNNQGMTVAELGQNYPNPSKGQTTLPFQIFEKVDEAAISIYNMLGQQVKVIKLENPTVGKHEVQWNSLKDKGLFIYKLEIRSGGQMYVSPLKKMIVL